MPPTFTSVLGPPPGAREGDAERGPVALRIRAFTTGRGGVAVGNFGVEAFFGVAARPFFFATLTLRTERTVRVIVFEVALGVVFPAAFS